MAVVKFAISNLMPKVFVAIKVAKNAHTLNEIVYNHTI